MPPTIRVYTFVTDAGAYQGMLRSFRDAEFDEENSLFVELHGPDTEPHSTITGLIETVDEPFFVMCHQDVRLDQGDGYRKLVDVVEVLGQADPSWAVAGNAGGRRSLQVARRITDPWGGSTGEPLPARVYTLDGNFLIVRTGTGLSCSPGLRGFHLYGADLALNAISTGRSVYVVDFHLRHLGRGSRDTDEYRRCLSEFVEHWRHRYAAKYVRTTTELLFLSRYSLLQDTLGRPRPRRIIKNRPWLGRFVGRLLAHRY